MERCGNKQFGEEAGSNYGTRLTFKLACFPCEEDTKATIGSIEKNRVEKNNLPYEGMHNMGWVGW